MGYDEKQHRFFHRYCDSGGIGTIRPRYYCNNNRSRHLFSVAYYPDRFLYFLDDNSDGGNQDLFKVLRW